MDLMTAVGPYLFGHKGVPAVGREGASAIVQDAVVIVADAEVRYRERVVLAEVVPSRCNLIKLLLWYSPHINR